MRGVGHPEKGGEEWSNCWAPSSASRLFKPSFTSRKKKQVLMACQYRARHRRLLQGDGPEVSVSPHHLGQLMKALQRSMKARRNLIGLIVWELFSKDKIFITRVLWPTD